MSYNHSGRQARAQHSANGVYERIKSLLVRQEFPAGRRIAIEKLAEQLFVSATPVREALTRLAAERIVQDVPNAGFFAKPLSQSELADLYDLQVLLLDCSASRTSAREGIPGPLKPPDFKGEYLAIACSRPEDLGALGDELFHHLARQSGNDELIRLICNLNDRTGYARRNFHGSFGDPEGACLTLCEAYAALDFGAVRQALCRYFSILKEKLPDLFRFLARSKTRAST